MESLKLQFKVKSCGNTQQFLILAIFFLLPFYFIKFKYSWISLNLVEILIISLFLIWILSREKKFSILNSQFSIPVGLIFTGLFLSTIISKNYYVGLGAIKGWFVLPILFAIIFYNCLKRSEKLLDWSLWALFSSGVLVSMEGIYYWFSGLLTFDGRLRIFYDSSNQLAMFLAPAFLVGLFLFLKETEKKRKAILAVGLLLLGLNLYLTFSYGAWLSLAVVLTILLMLILKNKKSKITRIAFISIFLLILFFCQKDNFSNTRLFSERSSLASRMMIWKSAGLMIKNNPLFGIGTGNFQNKYLEYQKYFLPYLEWSAPQPHNLYLAFWLESGLLGLTGFIWLLAVFFRDNKKVCPFTKINESDSTLIHRTKKQTGKSLASTEDFGGGAIVASRSYGNLCLVIMLYFLIHGLVDTTYWRNDMAILFWWIAAVNLYLAHSQRDSL